MTPGEPDEPAPIKTNRILVATPSRIPDSLETAAAWSWRILLIVGLLAAAAVAFWVLRAFAIPLFIAVLAATQLLPATLWLTSRGLPRWLAVIAVMIAVIAGIAFLTIVIVGSLVSQLDQIGHLVSQAADDVTGWLQHHQGPLKLTGSKVGGLGHQVAPALASAAGALFGGVIGGASLFTELVSGTALAFAFLIYILTDGEHVGAWIIDRGGSGSRPAVQRVANRCWITLSAYVRGVTIVAAFDGVLIGVGLVVLGVPIAGSLTAMVFLAAFIPIAGALVSGLICVAVALAGNGFTTAVVVLIIVLAVQEVESVVVDPVVYRKQVNLHPIATLAAVTVGGVLAGVIGALIAVPVVALGWTVVSESRRVAPTATGTRARDQVTPLG